MQKNHIMQKPWKPYEDSSLPFERIRFRLIPSVLAKRRFFAPSINLVGLSVVEIIIAILLTAGTVVLGYLFKDVKVEKAGKIAELYWIPLFILIMYRSPIALIFGVSFERSMFWHAYFALLALAFAVWHGVSAMYWAPLDKHGRRPKGLGFQSFSARRGKYQASFWSGAAIVIIMIVTIISSIHPIRRYVRRSWLRLHHALAVAAVFLCAIHGAGIVVDAFAMYIADRLFGYMYQALWKYKSMSSEAKVKLLPSGLVRLSFPNAFSFSPGQHICVYIPSVSCFEFHAFSIATCPSDEKLCVLIKPGGRWTKKLHERIQSGAGFEGDNAPIRAFFHGPIGSVALDWQSQSQYQTFLLVAGGIGITPLISFYRHVLGQAMRGRPVRKVVLIWLVRNRDMARDVLDTLLYAQGESFDNKSWENNADAENPLIISEQNFTAKIHITRPESDVITSKDAGGGANTVSKAEELLVNVRWNTGRANLRNEFESVRQSLSGKGRVAVLGCGPGALTRDVVATARSASKQGIHFDMHLEHFY